MSNEYLRIVKCPVCGKKFIPAAQHIYKVGSRPVCSWGCQREVEKKREAEKEKRKKRKAVDNA